MTFANPEWLWLLLLVPLLGAWEWRRWRRRRGGLRFGDVGPAHAAPRTLRARLGWLPAVLFLGALALGLVALARPQAISERRTRYAEGVDIMLVLDLSTSMRAQDLKPNRFEAARAVAAEFIRSRRTDRVGLIVFAAQAYLQAPLTLDYAFLLSMLADVEIGLLEDGTAIGTALAMAVNRLRRSRQAGTEETSKVVILLTDGQNNRGEIDPRTAAGVAAAFGVRVYAIGVGTRGEAPFIIDTPFGPRRQMMNVAIDEEVLRSVARATGGRYFRATSKDALRTVYEEISQLETTRLEARVYVDRAERYARFLWPAFALAVLSLALSMTYLRRFP